MTLEKICETEKGRLISFEFIQPIKPTPISLAVSVCARSANRTVCATQTLST